MSGRSPREQQLAGQIVVVLGGSSGIGLEAARRAREAGADMILTARDANRLHRIGLELGASISAFDLSDAGRLMRFFANLPGPVDHVLTSGAEPHYVSFAELDTGKIRQGLERIVLSVEIARLAREALKPTGSLLLISGTGGRRPSAGPLISAVTAATPALAEVSPSSSRPFASTRSRRASSIRRFPRRSSPTASLNGAGNCARSCLSGASSARRTSPSSPST